MSVLQAQRPKKGVYARGMIACRKCAAPVYVFKLNVLPDEFSLRCSKCGDRGLYLKREVAVEELPERRKKPRK